MVVFMPISEIAQSHTNFQGVATDAELAKLRCRNRTIPQFTDVTASAGITFKRFPDQEMKYLVETMGGGVVLIDYDRDGWPDIFFTDAPTVNMALKGGKVHGELYHNNHDGTFTDITAKAGFDKPCYGMGGAVGDYNNDGWPDLYLTCLGGNILYRNNGDGTFTDVTDHAGLRDGAWATGAAFGDYDGDGNLDLYVSGYVDFHLNDLPKFGSASTCKYKGVDVDCGPRGLKGAPDSLYHNNGNGTFTDVTQKSGVTDVNKYYGLGVIWSDFNNSGRPSLFVANDSTPNYLYRNDGNGKFTDIALDAGVAFSADGDEQANMGVTTGDYLHNGLPSIYTTTFEDEYFALFRNDGNWNFTDASYSAKVAVPSLPWVGWGTAFFDADNSGWLDLIAATGHVYPQVDHLSTTVHYREPMQFYMNEKNGTFCDASSMAGLALTLPRVSRGLAIGDLFHTGNIDVVVEDLDGAPMILKNNGVPGNHWISFELSGTKSNRLGIGAKLKVIAGGMTQTAELQSGGSYLSQNELRLHFGLAASTKVDKVEVHWPSGHVDVLNNLVSNRNYAVLEGVGIVDRNRIVPVLAKHGP